MHNNSFLIGFELESYINRSDSILSGVSTLNSQIYFTGTIASGLTAAANFTADFFSQMDMIFEPTREPFYVRRVRVYISD
jgi:hypothetical protein